MPDQVQTMNQRSRKSAEEEYDEIQKESRDNLQEPRCLRSCSEIMNNITMLRILS